MTCNMTQHVLSAILFCSSLSAFAGPNGAVFCRDALQNPSLSAYDIALGRANSKLMLFQSLSPEGRRMLQVETYGIRGELLELTEQVATVRYLKPNGQNAQALIEEISGTRMATVSQVKFFNHSHDKELGRSGSVVIQFSDGPTREMIFKTCRYEGGLAGRWYDFWE